MSAPDKAEIVVMERPQEWPGFEPLRGDGERIGYPTHALPPTIGPAVQEVSRVVQAPVEMVATTAISAVATVVQILADVRRGPHLEGPSSVNTLTVAGSGERKSAVNKLFFGPIREREFAERERLAPETQAYEAALQQWEAENEGLLRKIKGVAGGTSRSAKGGSCRTIEDLKDDHELHQDKKPVRPTVPRTLYQDSTAEAMVRGLSEYPSGALVSAEGGSILGGHSMQSDKSMGYMSRLNELWDGGSIHIGRVSVESTDLEGVRLSVCLAIQPETLQDFISRQGRISRGLGFWARFLMCEPRSLMGTRFYREAPESWPHLSDMQRRLAEIAETAVAAVRLRAVRPVLELSTDGKAKWVGAHDHFESDIKRSGDFFSVKDVVAKAADNVARLACLFHVFQHGAQGQISAEHVASASEIVAWHLYEARRIFGSYDVPREISDAESLEYWLIAKMRETGVNKIRRTAALKGGPSRLRKKVALDCALDELIQRHRVREVFDGGSRCYEVHPKLLAEAQ